MRHLHAWRWGPPDGRPVVCLHGVSGSGRHFGGLAERLPGCRVVSLDLLGHGSSPWEPPWGLDAQTAAVEASIDGGPATWIGHSYGGRVALEVAARRPDLVERIVLLDPAVWIPPHVALNAARSSLADRAYASFEQGIDRRFEESQLHRAPRNRVVADLRDHLVLSPDGRWRYRYSQSAVVVAYSDMCSSPPAFDRLVVPTLVVLGEQSFLPYLLLESHRSALGASLELVTVPGGHTVLWDALEETAAAVAQFVSG